MRGHAINPVDRTTRSDQGRDELAVVGVTVRQDIALGDAKLKSLLDHHMLDASHIRGGQDFTQKKRQRRSEPVEDEDPFGRAALRLARSPSLD